MSAVWYLLLAAPLLSLAAGCTDLSCLQLEAYRGLKTLSERPRLELWGGLALVRSPGAGQGRALESSLLQAESPAQRQRALEEYALDRVSSFLQERTLTWDLKQLVAQEEEDQQDEGRGKKKKLLKSLLPVLIGVKMKLVGFLVLSYFVIALIAKKALLASVVSLAISGFIAIKKLMSQQHHPEVHEVAHGWAGPSSGWEAGGGGGYDAHGAYSNSVAHSVAYGGQKPAARFSEKSTM